MGRYLDMGISKSAINFMNPIVLLFDHSIKLSYCSKTHDM